MNKIDAVRQGLANLFWEGPDSEHFRPCSHAALTTRPPCWRVEAATPHAQERAWLWSSTALLTASDIRIWHDIHVSRNIILLTFLLFKKVKAILGLQAALRWATGRAWPTPP